MKSFHCVHRLLLCLVLAGCARDERGNVGDENAPGSASVPAGAINADSLPTIIAVAELRMGHADDSALAFNSIRAVDVDRDGQLYVYDRQMREIRVFDRAGARVRTIGRRGSGPGEFGPYVSQMGVLGDSVWALDNSERKYNVFDRRGNVLSSGVFGGLSHFVILHGTDVGQVEPRRLIEGGSFSAELEIVRTDSRAVVDRMAAVRGVTARPRADDTILVPRLSVRGGTDAVDTIGWEPVPPYDVAPAPMPTTRLPSGREQLGIYVEVDGTRLSVPYAPGDEYRRVSTRDGSAVVLRQRPTSDRPSVFEIIRYNLDASVRHRLSFRYAPRRYDDPVLDSLAMDAAQRHDNVQKAFGAIRAAMKFPEFQSPIYYPWAANDSSLWLRREYNGGPSDRWLVIESTGTVRGVVLLPHGAEPRWARGEMVVATQPDERDVPWVVRYRVGWPPPPPNFGIR